MELRGECLACSKISSCSQTSVEKVRTSYTCSLFQEVPEPVYMARLQTMRQYGEVVAVEAMMKRPLITEEDEDGDDDDGDS